MSREVVVVSAVRTAIGEYNGGLKDVPPTELGALVVRESVARSGLAPEEIGHVVFGHVINTEPKDMYLSRVAALNGGLSKDTPAFNVNRLCGSGLQAIINASQSILLGDCDYALGGGAESMSRSPYILPTARWGARMGDTPMIDMMVGALTDPFERFHMGVTAENVATKYGITREEQDALAVESHRRAAAAVAAGYFNDQLVSVLVKSRKGDVEFRTDEHVRAGASIEDLAKLRPAFKKDGTVTAGNASSLNDAASAVVLAERGAAEKRGLKPLARLVAYAHAGVEPSIMGIGPVPASQKVLARAGLRADQLDVIEANEAFAAQALAVTRGLELDPAKVNPNGSGISLGHPIGATGAIITTKAIHELHRIGGRYALVTMCIGGGQGIAAIFERL
ncbi:beta-ketothiolase BktB [Derxia lacustris]|uniref:beta-ketothiolase BktB n=1 Tax=Derxia lacustris TaxID=764842 RepID=UPI000A170E0E|nr:beta-ketothiolase BktB [Derxia lacustris]